MLNEDRLPPNLQVERVGRIWYVVLPDEEPALLTVGYARVSSYDQKIRPENAVRSPGQPPVGLCRTAWRHTGPGGLIVASGLNDRQPTLRRLLADPLADPKVGTILVEHRDRLARFGVGMVEAMLRARGGGLLMVEENEVDDDLMRDMAEILTCFRARLYGRRSAAHRARRALTVVRE